uniref:NACHT-NTPase and P-loop NTPases N-terminal domain-containing protein n=1 Tax=Bionectria ochroleuca TaxID=29856 RepID=A0A8H7K9M2_BIOOC
MRFVSLLVLSCAALSAGLTPTQISNKFKKMENISTRCINKAQKLEAKDGININSPSSRFQDIFKGIDEIDRLANEISASVEALPSQYSSSDSTVVMNGYSSWSSQHQEVYVNLNYAREPFAGMAPVCNAIRDSISKDQDSLDRLGNALLNKVATSDRYVVTRIRAGLGKQASGVKRNYCQGINGGE